MGRNLRWGRGMYGFQLTAAARRVLACAREEAAVRCQDAVRTEQVALALCRDASVRELLRRLRREAAELAQQLDAVAPRTTPAEGCLPDLPFAHEALKTVELAAGEARAMHAEVLDADHLLLGVLRERCGLGGRVLSRAGLTAPMVRAAVARLASRAA